jgi:hypothetical protein
MGLDMYLEKRTYVKNWEHYPEDRKTTFVIKTGGKIREDIKPERIEYIIEGVGYWRKANHIHNWFINNCTNGDDNRTRMYVSEDELRELLAVCKKVKAASKLVKGKIKNGETMDTKTGEWVPIMEDGHYIEDATVAKQLLPTQSGFFFGSTDYDEYYLKHVQDTIDIIEPLLKEGGSGEYEYVASW